MTSTEAKVMLKCGHAANSYSTDSDGTRRPCCVICIGIHPGAEEIDVAVSLEGRQARCSCFALQPSSTDLAFFEYRGEGSREALEHCGICGYHRCTHDPNEHVMAQVDPNGKTRYQNLNARREGGEHAFVQSEAREFDSWYCGHGGWD